ncbi:phospholipase D-like domain-containing protein [Shewanella spartinae]|uniref:phospholipase D-like domain-containing protein n=1 Tax=Shewanella spartinae TaxID=2864205 RepID=UPI001C6591DC|nr:phospholipase D-like domain-containing protein [Shewanella spartinae]QYJ95709.1 phosphatidylserine/phosphatidylglycerophosphate/cardiolipin synthase family protein [Shewanella spartinae]
MNLINRFTKSESQEVDQSKVKLPPVFIPLLTDNASTPLSNNGSVYASNLQELAVELIDSAKESVVLCTFLLADERVEAAVYAAAMRKVRVYLLLACETRLEGAEPDDDFGKKCLTQHKSMLAKLSGHVHFASAPHFHAKAILVDALQGIDHAKGLLLTANLTNEALTRNEELAVSLSKQQISEFIEIFRWAIFESAEHHMINKGEFASYKSPGNVHFPNQLEEVLFTSSEGATIRERALQIIQQAERELIVSSFGWQEEHVLIEAICNKARAGVKVTVLARQRPAAMPALLAMSKAGAVVKCFRWLHAKAICADGNRAMIMTANLQLHGMDEGFELGIPLKGSQISELQTCLNSFIAKDHKELHTNMSLGLLSGSFEVWENDQFKEYSAKDSEIIELKPLQAECLSQMNLKQQVPKVDWRRNTSSKIEFKWIVKPPVISANKPEHYMPTVLPDSEMNEQKVSVPKVSYQPKVVKLTKKQLAITVRKESELALAEALKKNEFPKAVVVLEA